jgi:hypothetical protein
MEWIYTAEKRCSDDNESLDLIKRKFTEQLSDY